MIDILFKTLTLILIIVLGYVLKEFGVFNKDRDFKTFSNLIFYVTLPAAIITKFDGIEFPITFLFIALFGFVCNWMYLFVAKTIGKTTDEQQFSMININGYNIGNFALPFISYFLEGLPIIAISMFDAGSSAMTGGGNYAVAKTLSNPNDKPTVRDLLKPVYSSPIVMVYFFMLILSLLKLRLPSLIIETAGVVGSANTFLSLFMIGVILELDFDLSTSKRLMKYIFARYIPAAIVAVIINLFDFIPQEIKYTLTLILFAPISGNAPIFTDMLDSDLKLAGQMNSISIIISTIILTILLIFMLG